MIELSGQKFGKWDVLFQSKHRPRYWVCQCGCGTTRLVFGGALRSGASASCGCARRDRLLACNYRHGLSKTAEYRVWSGMKKRCYNPKTRSFPHYGGRGITVCEKWRDDFMSFLADVGPRPSPSHSIERKDNNGHYEPGNVYWATVVAQANNKRSVARVDVGGVEVSAHVVATRNGLTAKQYRSRVSRGMDISEAVSKPYIKLRKYTFNGQSRLLSEWAIVTGIPKRTLRARIDTLRWSIERALTTPPR